MDVDYFFYIHEGEDYISLGISEDDNSLTLSKGEGKMIIDLLQSITDRVTKSGVLNNK